MCFFIFFFSADDFSFSNVTLDTGTFFSFLPLSALQQLDGFIRIFLETGLDPLLVLYFMMRLLYPPFHPLASSTLNLLRSVVDSRRRRWDSLFPTLQWDVHMCFESFNTHRRLLVMGHHPIQYNNNKKKGRKREEKSRKLCILLLQFSVDR